MALAFTMDELALDDFYVPSAYYCILIEKWRTAMHFLSRIHISNVREYAKMEAYLVLKSKENIHVSGI